MDSVIISLSVFTIMAVVVSMFGALGFGMSKSYKYLRENPNDPNRFENAEAVSEAFLTKSMLVICVCFFLMFSVIVFLHFFR